MIGPAPSPGQVVRVRQRQYLVEEVLTPPAPGDATLVRLADWLDALLALVPEPAGVVVPSMRGCAAVAPSSRPGRRSLASWTAPPPRSWPRR
jgi:hypothetical protein